MASKKQGKGKGGEVEIAGSGETRGLPWFSPPVIRQFFGEVMAEFNKIVWPAKKVTAGLTGFVLILVMLIAVYLGSVDLILGKLVTLILH